MPLNWISIGIDNCLKKLSAPRKDISFGGDREEELWKDLMRLVNKYYPNTYPEATFNVTREEIEKDQ